MIREHLLKMEEEYFQKLSNLQIEFDKKIMELKKEFINKSNSILYKNEFIENNTQNSVHVDEYKIVHPNNIIEQKEIYKNSTRHIYYNLNVLIEKYLYCYNNNLNNGAVRWFRQIITYFPDEVNKFLFTYNNYLIKNYEIILKDLGYEKFSIKNI
jgi:hypothetical protein